MTFVLAILIGVIAGLRAMMAPAAISWAAAFGWLPVEGTALAFLGYKWTPYIFTALAAVELVADQLPSTPSRKVPVQFGTRILLGGLSGAAIGTQENMVIGLICGIVGAIFGTLGGAAVRGKLAALFGKDLPAALIEDVIAILGAVLIVRSFA